MNSITELIEGWMSESPRRNLSMLAKKSGVSYTTLRRLIADEQKPSISTELDILNVVTDTKSRADYLQNTHPDFAKLEVNLAANACLDEEKSDLSDWVENPMACNIAIFCSSQLGSTKDEIEKEFGNSGIRVLNLLLDSGAVYESEGRLKYADYFIKSPSIVLKGIQNSIKLIEDQESLEAWNWLHTGVSQDGLKEMKEATKSYLETLTKIRCEFSGNIRVTQGLFLGLAKSEDKEIER